MFWIPVKLTRTCDRCYMNFEKKLSKCPHCSYLTDSELGDFKHRREDELVEIAGLGKVFIVISILLLLFSLAAWNS